MGPKIARLRPILGALGHVTTAGRGRLTTTNELPPPPEPDLATAPVDSASLSPHRDGDELQLRDTSGPPGSMAP